MLEFSHIINQQPWLYYIYSEPINPIKSMPSKVPKMKLQRDKYILRSATLPTEVWFTQTDLLIFAIF